MLRALRSCYPAHVLSLPLLWCAVLLAAVCFMWSCSAGDNERTAGVCYIRLKKNPPSLDPARIVDLDSARIAAKLFNGLVTFDTDLKPVPDIAASWTISPDGRTYLFVLKKGVLFFNGREVTARDFQYSFERVLHPDTRSPRTWVLSRISGAKAFQRGTAKGVTGITAKDPYTLEIRLDEPFAPFLGMLGLTTAYVVPREEVERWGTDYGFHASGTGPFVLASWRHNQSVQLKAHDRYFGSGPQLDGMMYNIIPEDFTALVEFEKGCLDVLPDIMASEYSRFVNDPVRRSHITKIPSLNTYYLGLNCQVPPFDDVRVRRALNVAIDREKLLKTLMQGRGTIANGPLPPLLRGDDGERMYGYDPARAKELLRNAGYPQGFTMTLYQMADPENLDICLAIQAYLEAIGITVKIVQLEWSTFLDAVARGEAQSFWLSWWADYPDAENFLFPLFHSSNWGPGGNRSRFENAAVDALIDQTVKNPQRTQRLDQYRAIEKLIVREAPWVFFWHKAACGIHQPWVRGYQAVPLAVMEKAQAVSLHF